MRKLFFALLLIGVSVLSFIGGRVSRTTDTRVFTLNPTPVPTPLAKYTIETLKNATIVPGSFQSGELINDTKDITVQTFHMSYDPTLSNGPIKKVSGVINMPKEGSNLPLVVMLRGFVDQSIYAPGVGTKNGAAFFAENGFITVSPDFLGYASSDSESGNIFETRFQTYTTVLTLLHSIPTPSFSDLTGGRWDGKNIFIWAHSNGGQVALTTLPGTGESYPPTLWAPVTKPFPYSVLYYTDESADGGKFIRKELSKFETLYNTDQYSFTNYLPNIKGPLQFQQGTADDAIPFEWTRSIVNRLRKNEVEVSYFEYPGADHNMRPSWDEVIARDIAFFNKWMIVAQEE